MRVRLQVVRTNGKAVLSLRLLQMFLFSIRYGCLKLNITDVKNRKQKEKMKINSRWPTQQVANCTSSRDDIIFESDGSLDKILFHIFVKIKTLFQLVRLSGR